MNLCEYKRLLTDASTSDDEVFAALLVLLADEAPQKLSEAEMDDFRDSTYETRPDIMARLHAHILEQHSDCCVDKAALIQETGLGPDATFLDIARAMQQEE